MIDPVRDPAILASQIKTMAAQVKMLGAKLYTAVDGNEFQIIIGIPFESEEAAKQFYETIKKYLE